MLNRLSSWIRDFGDTAVSVPTDDHDFAATIAGLLVEAAMVDGTLEQAEKDHIMGLLTGRMDLDTAEAEAMLATQVAAHDTRVELHGLVRDIRDQTAAEDRAVIMEMIWTVVLADGQVDMHEAQLMRRLAGLLFVDDVTSAHAQQAAKQRLGIA
jgi:uncharacterized tellurite resistance protein B-like protein